jgi:hypothetical protein
MPSHEAGAVLDKVGYYISVLGFQLLINAPLYFNEFTDNFFSTGMRDVNDIKSQSLHTAEDQNTADYP